jgi:hypothetical protein
VTVDKLAHFLAGIAVAALAYPWGLVPAIVAVIVAAAGKELADMYRHGEPEAWDLVATLAGGVVGLVWWDLML